MKKKIILILLIFNLISCSTVEQTKKQTPLLEEEISEKTEISISAVGDIALGGVYVRRKRKYIKRIIDVYREIEKKHGSKTLYSYPFAKVKTVFDQSDISIGNWEGVASTNLDPKRTGKKYFILGPPDFARCLTGVIDLVTLANNHSLDYGRNALINTKKILQEAGIHTIGAGSDMIQARKPVIIEKQGVKVAFLGYTPFGGFASSNKAGVAGSHSLKEMKRMVQTDITSIQRKVDYIVVSYHWGEEYKEQPNTYQTHLGRATIDAGAHVVIGHHPHCVQGIEKYNNGLIFYSLGNFIFGANTGGQKKSFIAKIILKGNKIQRYELFPVYIFPPVTGYQPRLLKGKEKEEYLKYIQSLTPPTM